MSNTVTVRLLARWNEYPANSKIEVTPGQAEILLGRGMIAIPCKDLQASRKVNKKYGKRLSDRS